MTRHVSFLVVLLTLIAAAVSPIASAPAQAAQAKADGLPAGALVRLGATRLRMTGSVPSVAFSPDGKVLAATGHDGAVRLTSVATGMTLLELPNGTGRLA